jgi:alkylation response protein AidB-like acyl-CoA dehydrogenase
MLHLAADDEQLAIVEMTRSLGLEVLYPAAAATESDGAVPPSVWKSLFEAGLSAPLSEDLGGGGVPSAVTHLLAVEQLAYGDAEITLASMWGGAGALLISEHGTDAQRAELIARLANPESRCALALYEGFGRDVTEFQTTLTLDGDYVRVVGQKVAVPFAADADLMVVIGIDTVSGALKAALVSGTDPGITVSSPSGGLAMRAAGLSTVSFDTTIRTSDLLDDRDLAHTVGRLRLMLAAAQTGMAQRALEYAAEYAKQRIAFGKPIASFQGISFMLADAFSRTEQARLEILDAAALTDGQGDLDRMTRAVSAAVSYACENAAETTRNAVQVLGGHGFMTEYPVERWYRTAAFLSTLDFDPLASSFVPAF